MIHPDSQLQRINDVVGLGVRATAPIPCGTLLWVRDRLDLVLSPDEVTRLPPSLRQSVDRLGYQDASGRVILCWDAGKHINHSCAPVMRGVGHDAMIAVVDVEPGDELTCDYAECNLEAPLACLCGTVDCRKTIGGPVSATKWRAWHHEVVAAVNAGRAIDQPLITVCVDENLADVLGGRRPVPDLVTVAKMYTPASPHVRGL